MTAAVDALIIGAGPAGCVMAIRLQQLGFQTLIVERETFPRARVGESLSRGIWQQLHFLGLAEAIDALALKPCEVIDILWGNTQRTQRHEQPGLLADRAQFDQILLNFAIAHGAKIMMPAKLGLRSLENALWHCQIQTVTSSEYVQARWLVDASGSQSALGGRYSYRTPRTVAVHAHWKSSADTPRIASFAQGWCWRVPISCQMHVFAFVDQQADRKLKLALKDRYETYLRFAGATQTADKRLSMPKVLDASARVIETPINNQCIWIGEAAIRIDPLSASGVQLSIQTALQAALVFNTLVRKPERADRAIAFYANALSDADEHHQALASDLYAQARVAYPEQSFWSDRANIGVSQAKPRVMEPMLTDEFVL
jgi:flavin-dependent dehydrogenase